MIKNINKIVAVAIATVFLIPVVAFAEPSVSDAGSSGSAVSSSAPSTSDSGNAGVTSSPSGPSTSDQGNSAVSSSSSGPSTSDQGNSAVSNSGNNSTPSTSDQGNSGNTSSGGSSNNNGDSSGSRGGGRSSRSGGGRSISSAVINSLPVVNTSDCPYIASYMKFGGNNDVAQVTKLQTFLKNNEKLNVDVNGKFDQKTFDSVKAFQTKYANEILLPWGGSKATGHVFYTTQNKINELVCNKAIALTSVQLKAIQDFKDGRKNETVKIETKNDSVIKSDSASTTPVIEVGVSSTTDDEQTASAVEASVGSKVWSFVKWLFGYKK